MYIQKIPNLHKSNTRGLETNLHVLADNQGRTGQGLARYSRYNSVLLYLYTDIIISLTRHQHTKPIQRQRPVVL